MTLLVIENNHDYGVLNRIEEIGYNNLYYSLKSTHEYVDAVAAEARGGVAGFTMSVNKTISYCKTGRVLETNYLQ